MTTREKKSTRKRRAATAHLSVVPQLPESEPSSAAVSHPFGSPLPPSSLNLDVAPPALARHLPVSQNDDTLADCLACVEDVGLALESIGVAVWWADALAAIRSGDRTTVYAAQVSAKGSADATMTCRVGREQYREFLQLTAMRRFQFLVLYVVRFALGWIPPNIVAAWLRTESASIHAYVAEVRAGCL